MCGHAPESQPPTSGDDRAEALRRVIERDYAALVRRVGVLVYRVCGRLRPSELDERLKEVLQEAVRRAMEEAEKFDPQRSAMAWLMGFALNVLREQRRGGARRAVVQTDLGDAAWRQALAELCSPDSDTAAIRLDVRQALARLDAKQRRLVELRYFEGLDGEELAREVDAPTAGAARVRLARALQALRAVCAQPEERRGHDRP